ncbi:thioesterase domain-containing protein [Agrobacterium vitis]|uniref:Thioesterase domain-containing protein n=1 Tax=Agrobacterium vitis TaxID=373 RepID=A0AAE4WEF0_AGRVI|nr:thioesterase domain-containing protein [Agrobacterium vitis]MCF1501958.1 hypothetical protein [Allorhizobium sp. Av2]MUZ58624.1 hypothetical protein [Agrobacterium vitis]MVA19389.1 hypothetical protein [Agrobacterium vitis]MVA65683.1 hypothetical protein [Agrobacterium vitis]MVA88296.1 hypothetical protein [Agrobacterium vitis]
MILLLPDFVGYPFCYMGLMKDLGEAVVAVAEDYNDYWPYGSLEELAASIVSRHRGQQVTKVVGYSFGAHLAAHVIAAITRQGGGSPQLFMIDPPALEGLAGIDRAKILKRLQQDESYQYIFDLVDCELSNLDCMVENIWLLTSAQTSMPPSKAARIFMQQDRETQIPPESLHRYLGEFTRLSYVKECNHQTILKDEHVIEQLLDLLKT